MNYTKDEKKVKDAISNLKPGIPSNQIASVPASSINLSTPSSFPVTKDPAVIPAVAEISLTANGIREFGFPKTE